MLRASVHHVNLRSDSSSTLNTLDKEGQVRVGCRAQPSALVRIPEVLVLGMPWGARIASGKWQVAVGDGPL
jgi:hypothetical protein